MIILLWPPSNLAVIWDESHHNLLLVSTSDMNITDQERKQLRLPDTLWVQYGEVKMVHEGEEIVFTGKNDDAYLKVLNHFGRVLKLFTHESGQWEDADTGGAPTGFDLALAGRLPAAPHLEDTGKAAGKTTAKSKAKSSTKKMTAAKKPAGKAAAKSGKSTTPKTGAKAGAAKKSTGKSGKKV